MNITVLEGSLSKDPETKVTQSGKKVSRFTLAVSDGYNENKKTYFIDCISWESLADVVERLRKGSGLRLTGKIVQENWTGQDGQKRYAIRVVASMLQPIERRQPQVQPTQQNNYHPPQNDDDIPF